MRVVTGSYCSMVLLVAGLMLVGCSGKKAGTEEVSAPGAGIQPVEIVAQQHGQQSALKAPTLKLITSDAEFAAAGLEGAEPADFSTSDMVLVGVGEQPTGGYWVRITGIQQAGSTVYVQADINRPAPSATVTQALTSPYCLATVEKLGNVHLRSDFTSRTGQTPAE